MIATIRKAVVAIAIGALMILQVGKSAAIIAMPPAGALADANLIAEARVLNSFIEHLASFDKKGAELGKKPSLTQAEFASYERLAEDLKREVSGIQFALRQVIAKLKASGQWGNFDQIVLERITDSRFQTFARSRGAKKTLEDLTERSLNVNEIVSLVDKLRNRVAQTSPSEVSPIDSTLASRAVRVSYPTPAMSDFSVKCAIAYVHVAITRPFNGGFPSESANNAFNCYCLDFNCPTT